MEMTRETAISQFWRAFRQSPSSVVGAAIVGLYVLTAVLGPHLTPYDPAAINIMATLSPPSKQHLFGTDALGRDILTRVVHATRVDLLIGVSAVVVALAVGTVIGGVAGYYGGVVDEIIMRIMDVIQSFPAFILALGVVAVLEPGVMNIVAVIALINVPSYARVLRAELLSARERAYSEAARIAGNSNMRILFRHLLPNCMTPVFVVASINVGWAILITAGLSFLGLGVQPPDAEWGQMISTGTQEILMGAWWTSVFPGLALLLVVMGFNLLGDGLQVVFDPRRR